MNLEHLHRDLGRLEGQVTALQEKVDAMDAKLDAALAHINKAKGVSFAAGAVISAIVAFFTAWYSR